MKLNGVQATVAVCALILTAVLTYTGTIHPQIFVGVLSLIVGYYFGEARGLMRSGNKRR